MEEMEKMEKKPYAKPELVKHAQLKEVTLSSTGSGGKGKGKGKGNS